MIGIHSVLQPSAERRAQCDLKSFGSRLRAGLYGVGDGRAGADVAPLLVVADTERPVDEVTRPCVPVPVDAAGVVAVDPCC